MISGTWIETPMLFCNPDAFFGCVLAHTPKESYSLYTGESNSLVLDWSNFRKMDKGRFVRNRRRIRRWNDENLVVLVTSCFMYKLII